MTPLKIGILGFAHGHVGMYCARWQERPELGIAVVAGWDHDAKRSADNCARLKLNIKDSAEALLADPEISAVVIASETSFHAELVEKAAASGKAIVLQKPIALTLEEADRIVAAVQRFKVRFTLAWQMRVDPHNVELKGLLESGQFGKLFMLRRRHGLPTQHFKDFEKSWHIKPEFNRDIFADDAAHPIDFIYWLRGMPVSLVAELGTLLNPAVQNDTAIVIFRYADGSFAEVSCSFVAVAAENVTEALCEKGAIIGNYGDVPSTNIPRPPGGVQLKWFLHGAKEWMLSQTPEIKEHGERISGLALPLAEFLQNKRPSIATAEEGRDVLKLVLACYTSAELGQRVIIN
jgi:predicted dehydrogenase